MGGVRSKLGYPVKRSFQPSEHCIQCLGKALQFVTTFWDVKPFREIARIDLLSCPRNPVDWSQSPSAQPVATHRCGDKNKRSEQQNYPLKSINRIVEIIHRHRHLNAVRLPGS